METTSISEQTSVDVPAAPLAFMVNVNYHAIVDVMFDGPMMKQVQIHDPVGNVVASVDNCMGIVCQDLVLRGSPSQIQEFTLEAYCGGSPCGSQPAPPQTPLLMSGPVGSSPSSVPWVQTYLFHNGAQNHPESATDTMCITIIVQVGIDPTTVGPING